MLAMLTLCLAACHKPATLPAAGAVEVTVMPVVQSDTPVDFEFTAQTQSSREVEIRARVDGFLDKRVYTEGQLVHAGQTLFLMDPKPFEAALQTAKGQLAQQQARPDRNESESCARDSARQTERVEPEGSGRRDRQRKAGGGRRDRSTRPGADRAAEPRAIRRSSLRSTGLSSFARQQDGSYVTAAASGLLTYVYQLDPMWVNFSISENELLKYRDEIEASQLRLPGQ